MVEAVRPGNDIYSDTRAKAILSRDSICQQRVPDLETLLGSTLSRSVPKYQGLLKFPFNAGFLLIA
jgi:hypothetical protein